MEPRSLEELYRRYAGELYLYAYSLCQNRARAQDLTAEAFCRALLSLEGEGVRVAGLAVQGVPQSVAGRASPGGSAWPRSPPDLERLPAEGDILEELIRQETRRTVYQAVQALSPADREVITLYYYGELSLKEVGAAMGISPGRPAPCCAGTEETEDQIGGTAMTFRELLEKYRAGQASEERACPGGEGAGEERGHRRLPGEQVEDELGRRRPRPPPGRCGTFRRR